MLLEENVILYRNAKNLSINSKWFRMKFEKRVEISMLEKFEIPIKNAVSDMIN